MFVSVLLEDKNSRVLVCSLPQNERFRKPVEKLVRDRWGPFDAGASIPAAACDVSNVSCRAAVDTGVFMREYEIDSYYFSSPTDCTSFTPPPWALFLSPQKL